MNNMHKILHITSRIMITIICTASFASCTGHGFKETKLPTRINYHCANNRVLEVQRAADASTAIVLIDEKPVILQRESISATQEKYSDGNYLLYLQGERAMLEQNSRVLFGRCNAGPLPKTIRDGFPE